MDDIVESIAQRILLTVVYSAQYGFPLSREEIKTRLFRVGQKPGGQANNEWFSKEMIDIAIDRLTLTGCLAFDGKWYRLAGENTHYFDRQKLLKYSYKKRQEAQSLVEYLSKLSWVEGVAITGSLALNAADEKADADFLIVTKSNRLWLTRLLVLYFAIKHGKRRSFAHEEPNSWCFNLWLDSNHLFVPQAQHSLYTAYEVCQADWVINRHQTAEKFLLANSWVRQTLPVYYIYRQKQVKKPNQVDYNHSSMGRILSPVVTLANWASYLLQLLYMLPHRTTERVGMGHAWFHPKK